MKQEILHSYLIDVRDRGSACVEKRKLLWMLDRANDTPTAWDILLREWEEVGGDRATLQGIEWNGLITLAVAPLKVVEREWGSK